MTGVGVVVTVAGRRSHLRRLLEGLARQRSAAEHLVVVRMDDAPVDVPGDLDPADRVDVIDVPPVGGRLPLAAARNAGAAALDTDAVLFLDVDCIPGRDLVGGMRSAAAVDGLVCGTLRYLEPDVPQGDWTEVELLAGSAPHPARPSVPPGGLVREDRPELAWTTCLGMRRSTFERIGGFDERFTGYGGEDTDFGVRATAAGAGVWWSGDMVAFHQHHETGDRTQLLPDIVRNAELFASLHGWYPMRGWLESFRDAGLVDFDPAAGLLRLREPA